MGETGEASAANETLAKLDPVIRSLRRTRNKLGCGFILVVGVDIAMVLAGIFSEEAGIGITIFAVVCLLLAALGAKMISPSLSRARSPLVKLLLEHPEKIAWIYTAVDPGSGGVWGKSVNANDTDKKAYTFSVKA